MNWFDIAILVIVVLYLFSGISNGLIKQLFGMFGFIIILVLSFYGSRLLSGHVAKLIKSDKLVSYQEMAASIGIDAGIEAIVQLVAGVITFIVLFIVLQIVFRLLSRSFQFINRVPVIGLFNRIGGALLGLATGLVITFILVGVFSLLPVQFCSDALEGSFIADRVGICLPQITDGIKDVFSRYYLDTVNGT